MKRAASSEYAQEHTNANAVRVPAMGQPVMFPVIAGPPSVLKSVRLGLRGRIAPLVCRNVPGSANVIIATHIP